MLRYLTVVGVAWLFVGFPTASSGRLTTPGSFQQSDTLTLASGDTLASTLRIVFPGYRDLMGRIELRTEWLSVHPDTLELPSPAVLVLKPGPIDFQLRAPAGDPALRIAFHYAVAGATTQTYCVAEGSTLRVLRDVGMDRPKVLPDRALECHMR